MKTVMRTHFYCYSEFHILNCQTIITNTSLKQNKMFLKDTHDHTKRNSKIYQLEKHHRPLFFPLPLPLRLLL